MLCRSCNDIVEAASMSVALLQETVLSGTQRHVGLRFPAVRWFSEQHSLELQASPGVRTVANLVMQV